MKPASSLPYKVETKNGWWLVDLRSGCYSGREDEQLFFRANNSDEVWHYLVQWFELQDNAKGYGWTHYFLYSEEYGRYELMLNKEKEDDDHRDNWEYETPTDYNTWGVTIMPLPVIHFK